MTSLLISCSKGPKKISGDKLNDYFPKDGGGFSVLVTTEKTGFAQASLKSDGSEVATIAISDLVNDDEATQKFNDAGDKIAGFPTIGRGNAGTATLVEHFQVQVRSKADSFGEADRKAWLKKCDLSGLAKIR